MRLQFIAALFLALSATPSYSNCEDEVASALQNFWQSGPFHFNSQEWNINFMRQTAGVIVPNEAQYISLRVQNGYDGNQTIYKGKQSWTNDGEGWIGPHLTIWSFSVGVPKSDLLPLKVICVREPKHAETQLKKFSFYTQRFAGTETVTSIEHTIYVNTHTGHIVRYEREGNEKNSINEISTFRFDNNLTVEIPTVDTNKRKERLLRRYDEEAAESDVDCRSHIISILDEVHSSHSFEYEIKGQLWSGVSGIKGKFVPPNSINYFVEGVPYHGGDTEVTLIGDKQWYRRKGDDWYGPVVSDSTSEYGFFSIGQTTVPHSPQWGNFHMGAARCSKLDVTVNDNNSSRYAYDVFVDTNNGRTKGMNVTMHIDSKTDLPTKFEMRYNELSPVVLTEVRKYKTNINITEPITIERNHDLVPELVPFVVPLNLER